MKNKRFQYIFRSNASELHKKVGELLREGYLGGFEFYQEYPVNKVDPTYTDGRHKFDWVCPQLKLVIECHGKQHYKVVNFGYASEEEAIEAFYDGQRRDRAKQKAAYNAGYNYIVIPYTMKKNITSDKIHELIKLGELGLKVYNEEHNQEGDIIINERHALASQFAATKKQRDKEARKQYLQSDRHQESLRKAREYRKVQYQRYKEIKDGSR